MTHLPGGGFDFCAGNESRAKAPNLFPGQIMYFEKYFLPGKESTGVRGIKLSVKYTVPRDIFR
ncbi:hypothetical protein SY88_16340 [Clostridiales bacterium PH28_bin88]|nr:hypothetical protein SY88_16340 [Clostridiales bacterium PH28_bin88]